MLSPNRSPRDGWRPIATVIHITDGSGQGALAWLTNAESHVSAHFLVQANGRVHQLVPLDEAAWHAGRVDHPTWDSLIPGVSPNVYTVGIEIEGTGAQTIWPDAQVASVTKLVAALRKQGIMTIIPHRAINASKTCPGTFPWEAL